MKNKIIGTVLFSIVFIYGVVVGNKRIFPYEQVRYLEQVILSGDKSSGGKSSGGFGSHYEHKKSQFELLSNTNKSRIVMLGDSIIERGLWHELTNRDDIVNRGISGDTTAGILNRIGSLNNGIEKAFIMIGTNDLGSKKSVEYIFLNYKEIIEYLEKKGIKPYIQSVLYVGKYDVSPRDNNDIKKLNDLLIKFSIKKGITFIDLNKVLSPEGVLSNNYSLDNLHLNGKAYILWADTIKPYF